MKSASLYLLLFGLLGFTCPAFAALSLVPVNPIQFGTILRNAPTVGGTVRIAKIANTRSTVSGSYVFAQTGISGLYQITGGTSGQIVNVSITSGTISRTGGGTLTVSNITTNMTTGTGTGTVTLNGLGIFNLQVGCDLAIGANQQAGIYSGTLSVSLS